MLSVAITAHAQTPKELKATLVGYAALPADSFQMPPKNAPAYFKNAGRYAVPPYAKLKPGQKEKGISFLSTPNNPRPTGWHLPLKGQPIQGFSGIITIDENNYWVIVDNGFGYKVNSHDALLKILKLHIDWPKQRITVEKTIFLNDQNHLLPFPIAQETHPQRYLTGADLDPESLQIKNNHFFIGDEFGPFLLEADLQGTITSFHELTLKGKTYYSVDHPLKPTAGKPNLSSQAPIARSRGFEGMALSPNKRYLYPMLEGALYHPHKDKWDEDKGKRFLSIFQFDTQDKSFTTRRWRYLLEDNTHNIGDFNFIDDRHAWVIERDNREGDPFQRCAGKPRANCFDKPAIFKRLYLVDLNPAAANHLYAKKIAYVDLMNIEDGLQKSPHTQSNGTYNMPFFTIENVDVITKDQVIVGNDNNLPFSSGRTPLKNDDNEMVWLKINGLHQVLK